MTTDNPLSDHDILTETEEFTGAQDQEPALPVEVESLPAETPPTTPAHVEEPVVAVQRIPTPGGSHWYSLPGTWDSAPAADADSMLALGVRRTHHQSTRDRVRKRKIRRQQGVPDNWAWMTIGSALVGVVFVMTMAVFFLLRAANNSGSTIATSVPGEPTSVFYGDEGGLLEGSLVIQPWDGQDRFTVLLMGMDKRPGEAGTAFLTDTIILISLDPTTRRIGILSVPRDLQMEVPDFGVQPINTVYRLGELDGVGGGPTLAMTTLQYNLGLPINEYMIVDFNTFITMVDLIGGIEVDVKQTIDDPKYPDMNYGYDPFYLAAGWQHLDGATALKYARSRHQTDDIDRASRQQQVLYAVRDKVISADMLPELAAKAYPLWAELKQGINTSLDIEQILELAWYVKDVPRQNIVSGVIGWDYIIAENWDGRPIIRPNREVIPGLLQEVFGSDFQTQ